MQHRTNKPLFPVPALSEQIKSEWREEITALLVRSSRDGETRDLSCLLNSTVRIVLMDESVVEFHHAVPIISESKRAIAVFTEHCGSHVFPNHDAQVYVDRDLVYENLIGIKK